MHLLAPNIRGFIVHSKWYKELTIKYTQMPQDKVFLWAFPVLPSILQRPIVPTAARDIDVLVYAKFTDERHLEGLEAVMSRLNAAAIRSVLMSYGTFTRDQLLQTARESDRLSRWGYLQPRISSMVANGGAFTNYRVSAS